MIATASHWTLSKEKWTHSTVSHPKIYINIILSSTPRTIKSSVSSDFQWYFTHLSLSYVLRAHPTSYSFIYSLLTCLVKSTDCEAHYYAVSSNFSCFFLSSKYLHNFVLKQPQFVLRIEVLSLKGRINIILTLSSHDSKWPFFSLFPHSKVYIHMSRFSSPNYKLSQMIIVIIIKGSSKRWSYILNSYITRSCRIWDSENGGYEDLCILEYNVV